MNDEELKRTLEQDLAAPNPELEGVDLLPAIRARLPREPRAQGPSRLYLDLYWGDRRVQSRAFDTRVTGGPDDAAGMPLWGFAVDAGGMTLAELEAEAFRVFAPPGAAVEHARAGDALRPARADAGLLLAEGDVARFSSGDLALVARVGPPPPAVRGFQMARGSVVTAGIAALLATGFAAAMRLAPDDERPDFVGKGVSPVAVRLVVPEPKQRETARKKLEAITRRARTEQATVAPKKTVVASRPRELVRSMKALDKLSAAGPAMKDLLAMVDKLGGGPGKKDGTHKLSDLIGKAPITGQGLGTFGLGGAGTGGVGTKGLEVLRGKGGAGIGALGAGNVGKGAVGGAVTRASMRNVSAAASIDREAVARVINSHLHEVSACYERALLRDPGLAGKIVLEWTVSTAGAVTVARTKSSTMKSSAVEACILVALKGWKFPASRGGSAVISYPFLFNSVGY